MNYEATYGVECEYRQAAADSARLLEVALARIKELEKKVTLYDCVCIHHNDAERNALLARCPICVAYNALARIEQLEAEADELRQRLFEITQARAELVKRTEA